MSNDANTKVVFAIAGTNTADAEAYRTMAQALRSIADDRIDTGAALGMGADFWLSIAGIEYFITAKRSKKQRVKDGSDIQTESVFFSTEENEQ